MKTIEFFDELLWGFGLGLFISGVIITQQSNWSNWTITGTGFFVLLISTFIKARIKK